MKPSPLSPPAPARRARRIAIEAMLAALVVVSGRLKVIPNVEWVSLLCMAAGLALGAGPAIRVAAAGEFLYSVTSPYGLAPPLVLAAQVVGMVPCGVAGGVLRGRAASFWIFGIAGFLCTLWFDLCTNFATGISMGSLGPALVAALPFSAVHILSNVVMFAALGPLLSRRLSGFSPAAG